MTTRPRLDLALAASALLMTPIGLAIAVGRPDLSPGFTWEFGLGLVATMAWLSWAWCMIALIRQVVRLVIEPGLDAVGTSILDRLAAAIAAAVLSLAPFGLVATSAGGAAPRTNVPSAAPTVASSLGTTLEATQSVGSVAPTGNYRVVAGDSLWSIADHLYGDGEAWTQLSAANLGHLMTDGRVFTDPSLILPGWVLLTPGVPPPASPAPTASSLPAPPAAQAPVRIAPLAEVPVGAPPRSPYASPHDISSSPASPTSSAAVSAVGLLGGGAVVLGVLARRRRRTTSVAATDEQIDDEVALLSLAPSPMASLSERALLLADGDEAIVTPGLLAVGPDGADLYLDGRPRWHAEPVDLVGVQAPAERAPGALVPLGDHEGRSWSLVVPPGAVARIGGPCAEALVVEAMHLQRSLAWGDLMVIVEHADAAEVAEVAERCDAGVLVMTMARGDTGPIDGAATLLPTDDADAIITIDPESITLFGGQLTIPHAPLAPGVGALLRDAPRDEVAPLRLAADANRRSHSPEIMIRLLAPAPRVDGLASAFAPNRARRCTELISYLALHRPDPVTGDRLRMRVLGTSQADAAAKTLFNVTSEARRSLGDDRDGNPHLPPAGRDGLYRIGTGVSIDVLELSALFEASTRANDHEAERALLAQAIDLVEGEPMATVLAGYEWFVAEGHRARLDASLEQAAARLIELSLAAGDLTSASAALEAVRPALPYSEIMAERAMEVAAASGDLAGLVTAFEAIQQLSDQLSPGAGPSDEVEERFASLVRHVRGEHPQASLAAMDAAPRNTSPSAPAAL